VDTEAWGAKLKRMTREDAVGEVVRRLVEHYRPERIYLFGSSARGDASSESDLDFLVVLPDNAPRETFFDGRIYERLWDIPLAIDIVPFRHKTFEERSGWLMSLPAIALREGDSNMMPPLLWPIRRRLQGKRSNMLRPADARYEKVTASL
jgi:predicted nucleotidyltransferase